MRNFRHVSSEAFPHNLELFLSGGAGAPLAPLAETPMVGVGGFFYHETPNFNHNFHLYLIFNLDFRIILILLLTIYLYNAYAAELSFTFFCRGVDNPSY